MQKIFAVALSLAALSMPVFAAEPARKPAESPTATKTVAYSSANTEIGTLLDDPAATALLEKFIPGMTANDQIEMARAMTLKDIQQYSPDQITDERLAALDAELAKLAK